MLLHYSQEYSTHILIAGNVVQKLVYYRSPEFFDINYLEFKSRSLSKNPLSKTFYIQKIFW